MWSLLHSLLIQSLHVDPDPRYSASLPIDHPLPPIEMNTSAPSKMDFPIAQRKGKRSCTQHLISNYVFYNHLTHYLISFLCLFSVSIPKFYKEALM